MYACIIEEACAIIPGGISRITGYKLAFIGQPVISGTRNDWLTNKGKFVCGNSWELAPFVPSRGGCIKRYQDIKAKFRYLLFLWNFAVSGDFLF